MKAARFTVICLGLAVVGTAFGVFLGGTQVAVAQYSDEGTYSCPEFTSDGGSVPVCSSGQGLQVSSSGAWVCRSPSQMPNNT